MRKTLHTVTICTALALSACDYINNKVLNNSLEGTYENAEGGRMEFTESKVTYQGMASFDYKVEGKYLFVENFGMGELKYGDIRYEIIDGNTIRLAGGLSTSDNEGRNTYKKVEE